MYGIAPIIFQTDAQCPSRVGPLFDDFSGLGVEHHKLVGGPVFLLVHEQTEHDDAVFLFLRENGELTDGFAYLCFGRQIIGVCGQDLVRIYLLVHFIDSLEGNDLYRNPQSLADVKGLRLGYEILVDFIERNPIIVSRIFTSLYFGQRIVDTIID